ncbi:MAG: translation initiation factor IF-1 [Candidatus Niyogibacteria bacterium]|nr:MAG: translation initiation factor IF-1 [Candidatus Niyogibacteria bacterium]
MAADKENKEIKLGTVIEALPDTMFRVQLDDGPVLLAYLAGKMRHFRIKVLIGDKVKLELSPYDQTRGRIIQRL